MTLGKAASSGEPNPAVPHSSSSHRSRARANRKRAVLAEVSSVNKGLSSLSFSTDVAAALRVFSDPAAASDMSTLLGLAPNSWPSPSALSSPSSSSLSSFSSSASQPVFSSHPQPSTTRAPGAQARAIAGSLWARCRDFVSRRRFDPSSVLRGDGARREQLSSLGNTVCGGYGPSATPQRITAADLSLPDVAGTVDPLQHLPPGLCALYGSPNSDLLRDAPLPRAGNPRFNGSHAELVATVRRLLQLGMVTLIDRPRCVNGLFAVPKAGSQQLRLIIDGRPANALFLPPANPQLPSPEHVASLRAPAGQPVFAAKCDLSNFFHKIRLPQWLVPYFALPAVRLAEVRQLAPGESDRLVYPACTTLPMGWSHSVVIAQAVHRSLLLRKVGLRAEDEVGPLSLDRALDRSRWFVYIDDLCWLGPDASVLAQQQQRYVEVMDTELLPVNGKKTVLPTLRDAELLGLAFDGSALRYGLHPDKLQLLRDRTLTLLQSGYATGTDVARLVGSWAWACLVCRSALSCFRAVYRYAAIAQHRRFALWSDVRRELLTVSRIAPLLSASLSRPFFNRVLASDASSIGQGVVAARATQQQAAAVSAVAGKASLPEANWEERPFRQIVSNFVASSRWTTLVSSRWARQEHVNVLETRALRTATRWALATRGSVGSDIVVLSDSAVVVAAAAKGRSSSSTLYFVLASLAAAQLAADTRVVPVWLPSAANPADAPSRLATNRDAG